MKTKTKIVLKVLALLLLFAAVLKGWQIITEPVANTGILTSRPFLILTIEFELALSIWLLSGLFKKAAWLTTLLCFSLFSFVSLYKALTGAESCGCFGSLHVNPWLTLFAIDIPAVILLAVFRPMLSFLRKPESIAAFVRNVLTPLPSIPRLITTVIFVLIILTVTTSLLAFNKPAKVTSSYEVLEPKTWLGKQLPVLKYIDIADKLKKGSWLILFYHYDCSNCIEAVSKYEQMTRDLKGNEDFLRIALIEVPPFGQPLTSKDSPCTLSRLSDAKEWFITTPAVVLLTDGRVKSAWEAKTPALDAIIKTFSEKNAFFPIFITNILSTQSPYIERRLTL